MKPILTLLIVVFLSFTAYAQTEPFKKANAINIETGLPAAEAYKAWGQHLAANGYTIDKSNPEFMMITTGPKDTSKYNFDFIINSVVDPNGLINVRLKWRLKNGKSEFTDWDYAEASTNVKNVIYRDFLPVIQSFGKPVSYLVK